MALDLAKYFKRTNYTGPAEPTLETLHALHLAHATHIPFENLDILLGRPIRIDLDSVFAKLVERNRGGYCFEQNTLFSAVLEELGFKLKRLNARVRMGYSEVRPRTHMLLLVEADGERWLADVGFGGEGLLHPLAFRLNEVMRHYDWQYRIVDMDGQYLLQSLHPEGWFDLYSFTLDAQHPVDFEVANHYTSTHPDSRFVQYLVTQKPGIQSRFTLVNDRLTEQTPRGSKESVLPNNEAILKALGQHFGLVFPQGTVFKYRERSAVAK